MKTIELYNLIIEELSLNETEILPLYKAMLEECCESAINNPQQVSDTETLKFAAMTAFEIAYATLKGTLKALIEDNDQITLNYRNQTFIIPKDSKLLE